MALDPSSASFQSDCCAIVERNGLPPDAVAHGVFVTDKLTGCVLRKINAGWELVSRGVSVIATTLTDDGNTGVAVSVRLTGGFKHRLQFPGGTVDEGETPIEAARRELKEETSVDLPPERFQFLGQNARVHSSGDGYYMGYCFRAILEPDEAKQVKAMEPEKQTPWVWLTLDQVKMLDAAFIPGLTKYLDAVPTLPPAATAT